MKRCTKGNHDVPLDQFSKSSRNKDGLQVWCKACLASYANERYNNGDRVRLSRNQENMVTRNKEYLWSILAVSECLDCQNPDPRVLEFDHLDPSTKVANVTEMLYRHGLKKIKEEIAKCVIRCANCHKIKTGDQFGYWRSTR